MRSFIWIMALCSFFAAPAHAENYKPLDHMWQGTRDVPDTQNLFVGSIGAVLTLGAFALDRSTHDYFANRNRLGGYGKIGDDFLGTGIAGGAIGIGTLVYGLLKKQPHEIQAGEAHLEALLAAFIYTEILKYSVRRPRPDSDSKTSFPSGHTSTAFTSASSLLDMYGWQVGAPAMVLATFTGVARLSANAHHLSDVIFGATLGLVVGHAYARHHNQENEQGDKVSLELSPYYEASTDFGLNATLRF